jgi:hypothetical protein
VAVEPIAVAPEKFASAWQLALVRRLDLPLLPELQPACAAALATVAANIPNTAADALHLVMTCPLEKLQTDCGSLTKPRPAIKCGPPPLLRRDRRRRGLRRGGYKAEPGATHYGLIAEEVDKVMPELVVRDEENRPESVQYQELISLQLQQWKAQQAENAEQRQLIAEQRRLIEQRAQAAALDHATIERLAAEVAEQRRTRFVAITPPGKRRMALRARLRSWGLFTWAKGGPVHDPMPALPAWADRRTWTQAATPDDTAPRGHGRAGETQGIDHANRKNRRKNRCKNRIEQT